MPLNSLPPSSPTRSGIQMFKSLDSRLRGNDKQELLRAKFFNRDTVRVARDLLGTFLVRKIGNRTIALMITETEAYDGPHDKASHAHRGRTARNEVMFGVGGSWYVYLIYGMHWMLNITTGAKNYPAAVLIRAGIAVDGKIVSGPGKVTKYLQVNKNINTLIASKKNGLWIEDRGVKIKRANIVASKRIGVDYAGEWAEKLYNFKLVKNPYEFE